MFNQLNRYEVTFLNYWNEPKTKEFSGQSEQDAKMKALQDVDVMEIVNVTLKGSFL